MQCNMQHATKAQGRATCVMVRVYGIVDDTKWQQLSLRCYASLSL